jgi:hypothetical protein
MGLDADRSESPSFVMHSVGMVEDGSRRRKVRVTKFRHAL